MRASIAWIGHVVSARVPLPWPRPRRCTNALVVDLHRSHGPGCGDLPYRRSPAHGGPHAMPAFFPAHFKSGTCRARRAPCDLTGDGPDEGRQLASDGRGDHRRLLALARQPAKPLAQPDLGFPGDLARRPWGSRDQHLLLVSDARRMTVSPRGLHQHTQGAPVAGLGDRAAHDALAARSLARHQAEDWHELARVVEARRVAGLSKYRHGRDE